MMIPTRSRQRGRRQFTGNVKADDVTLTDVGVTCGVLILYLSLVTGLVLLAKYSQKMQSLYSRHTQYYEQDAHGRTSNRNRTVLTLFTTCGNKLEKVQLCKNVIMNWAKLLPQVNLILFDDNDNLALFAEAFGWSVHQPPMTSLGLPVLRSMFHHAMDLYDTDFYAYANGDILFTDELLKTLKGIQQYHFHGVSGTLVVGRRTNFNTSLATDISLSYNFEQVRQLASNGKLFQVNAQDYFIVTRHAFNWSSIPDFIVGRVGYDNWILATAITNKVAVIDATETILALHQTGEHGNFEGHTYINTMGKQLQDALINKGLAGKHFNYQLGRTFCSTYVAKWNQTQGTVIVIPREKFCEECIHGFKVKKMLPLHIKYGRPLINSTSNDKHDKGRTYNSTMIENELLLPGKLCKV